jgi:2-polyprenyl-3-methyl-5-hydroxy-6-metoxy-1,4-benzoquinol methylase
MHARPGFGQDWPTDELEEVPNCLWCGASLGQAAPAATHAQDWAFRAAPGRWTYLRCNSCQGLSLSPRPAFAHIGHAYSRYYTHAHEAEPGLLSRLKDRVRAEAWAIGWGADVAPRLHLPKLLWPALQSSARKLYPGFVIASLAGLPRGKFLDVGCGNGRYLDIAQRLGFAAQGMDPDPAAVQAVKHRGLNALQGGFAELPQLPSNFDVVLASHTLEHSHTPMAALQDLLARLKPGGVLLLAMPNAQSPVFDAFGPHWRGLEAPRHLGLASSSWLKAWLQDRGHTVQVASVLRDYTWAESADIAAQAGQPIPARASSREPDLIEWVITQSYGQAKIAP